MKKFILIVAACSLIAAQSAQADRPLPISFDYFPRPVGAPEGGPVGLPYMTGFETFEGFVVGSLNLQNGWQISTSPEANTIPAVSVANPFAGAQHMRIQDDPTEPAGFAGVLGFGPSHDPATVFKVMVNISNTGGADYFLNPQSPALGIACTRVDFHFADYAAPGQNDPDATPGDILVISDPDGPGPLPGDFINTGVEYTPGVYKEFRIEYAGGGMYNYFYDGAQIAGPLFGFHNAQGQACNGWTEMVYVDDQFQLDANERADFDNHMEIPEPAAIALLGLAALMLRRRR